MISKRYKKLPTKTASLLAVEIEKLIPDKTPFSPKDLLRFFTSIIIKSLPKNNLKIQSRRKKQLLLP